MSPVFRHGRLRLYLLKLLDEAPRHGYEIIRLLQDRFLGVYAPSPGTIYPRLARLEEEGLVTHDEADGKKVYRITDKGREELASRLDDLAELEDTITASVRDIAREVTEDVRETVRSLREELTWAVRDVQFGNGGRRGRPGPEGGEAAGEGRGAEREHAGANRERSAAERKRRDAEREHADAEREHADAEREHADAERERRDAERERLDAEQERLDAEQRRLDAERERLNAEWDRHAGREGKSQGAGGRGESRGRRWAGEHGPDWGEWSGWASWAGRGWRGPGPGGCADPHTYRDLERLARRFSRDLRAAAWQAQAVSEDAVRGLRDILDEAIGRIKDEVFTAQGTQRDRAAPPEPGPHRHARHLGPDDPHHPGEGPG